MNKLYHFSYLEEDIDLSLRSIIWLLTQISGVINTCCCACNLPSYEQINFDFCNVFGKTMIYQ